MNVFRLVLCLSGLMTYLVVRLVFQPASAKDLPQSSAPTPESVVPKTPRPQTAPHVELLKPERSLVNANN
jgi:hypothetical protein